MMATYLTTLIFLQASGRTKNNLLSRKHAVLSIRDYSNGKTVETPDALPGFALDRRVRSIERHKQAHA